MSYDFFYKLLRFWNYSDAHKTNPSLAVSPEPLFPKSYLKRDFAIVESPSQVILRLFIDFFGIFSQLMMYQLIGLWLLLMGLILKDTYRQYLDIKKKDPYAPILKPTIFSYFRKGFGNAVRRINFSTLRNLPPDLVNQKTFKGWFFVNFAYVLYTSIRMSMWIFLFSFFVTLMGLFWADMYFDVRALRSFFLILLIRKYGFRFRHWVIRLAIRATTSKNSPVFVYSVFVLYPLIMFLIIRESKETPSKDVWTLEHNFLLFLSKKFSKTTDEVYSLFMEYSIYLQCRSSFVKEGSSLISKLGCYCFDLVFLTIDTAVFFSKITKVLHKSSLSLPKAIAICFWWLLNLSNIREAWLEPRSLARRLWSVIFLNNKLFNVFSLFDLLKLDSLSTAGRLWFLLRLLMLIVVVVYLSTPYPVLSFAFFVTVCQSVCFFCFIFRRRGQCLKLNKRQLFLYVLFSVIITDIFSNVCWWIWYDTCSIVPGEFSSKSFYPLGRVIFFFIFIVLLFFEWDFFGLSSIMVS